MEGRVKRWLIVRLEHPTLGAQLRFTALAADAHTRQSAQLELRHCRRAYCKDCIRKAKDTGLRDLPPVRFKP